MSISINHYVNKWTDKYITKCLSHSKNQNDKLTCLSHSLLTFSKKKYLLDKIQVNNISDKQQLRFINQQKAFKIVYDLLIQQITKLNQKGGDGIEKSLDPLHSIITNVTQHDDLHDTIAKHAGLKKEHVKEIATHIGDAISKSLSIYLNTGHK
jgi:hypothetical protein